MPKKPPGLRRFEITLNDARDTVVVVDGDEITLEAGAVVVVTDEEIVYTVAAGQWVSAREKID